MLLYFGYPQAHEDDAERAVRAGLKLVAAVGGLKTHAPLQTRVGIATGLVVVGDLIGSGASQEQAIVGETPNLSARLQGIAEPNCVVIAESTRKLVGNLFELEDLGAKSLKGVDWSISRGSFCPGEHPGHPGRASASLPINRITAELWCMGRNHHAASAAWLRPGGQSSKVPVMPGSRPSPSSSGPNLAFPNRP
jgi:Adenylate and Guanylate cyclase catalytic domain